MRAIILITNLTILLMLMQLVYEVRLIRIHLEKQQLSYNVISPIPMAPNYEDKKP
jgi:hypothetical protein